MFKTSKRLGLLIVILVAAALVGGNLPRASAQGTLELTFYYPTAVGGPVTKIIDGYTEEFNKANPGIKVTSVYSGGYDDIYKAVQTQISGGGKGPDVAIFLAVDTYSLVDNDYIVPLDSFIKNTKDGDKYLADFFPAFMANSVAFGQTWAIPFQRSTPILYYNKAQFKEVGLDPNTPPKTWQDLADYAKKLTTADGKRWGLLIPSDGLPYWLFQGFALSNGQNLVEDAANKVYFNTPTTIEALQFVADLSTKYNGMPKGVIKWGDAPTAFWSGTAAMIYHTTGSLTNILANAKFDVGVAFLPQGKKGYGTPTGGGNLYILKTASPEKQQAAWKWIQFLTSPEKQADWTAQTGYIGARKAAWETDALKKLVADKPQYGIARDQLQYAGKELATHQGGDIRQIFAKAVQSVITGEKTPKQALDEAQTQADKILAEYPDEPKAVATQAK